MAPVKVEIEGISPNSVIEVGERRTVMRTELVKNMVRGGFIKIVRLVPAEREEKVYAVPNKNASKSVWQSFLRTQGIKFESDNTRADLIALWEQRAA